MEKYLIRELFNSISDQFSNWIRELFNSFKDKLNNKAL